MLLRTSLLGFDDDLTFSNLIVEPCVAEFRKVCRKVQTYKS